MPTYDLFITAQGSLSGSVSSLIADVASAIDILPGYRHISTNVIQRNDDTSVVITRYETDEPEITSMAIPLIVYAVLAVLATFGLLALSYYLIEVAPTTVGGTILLFAIGTISAAYLISKIRSSG